VPNVRKKIRGIQKGINTYTANYELPDNELEIIENWDINEQGYDGVLRKRYGYDRISTNQLASGGTGVGSMFEATINLSGTATDLIVANIINGGSSGLYYTPSNYTGGWTAITGSASSNIGYKLNYSSYKDKVYIANIKEGTVSNKVWDGTTTGYYDMGCPPPNPTGISFTQLAGAGALSAGLYRYLFTYLYDGFQESSAITYYDVSAGVDLAPVTTFSVSANDGIQIDNIPVGSARVTARKIYRSKAGTTTYYYLTTIQDNTSTSFKDGLADNSLGDAIDTDVLCTPNKPQYSKYVAIHKERGVLANLTESLYDAIPTGDITLTGDAGGSLDLLGVYKYRFYKAWRINVNTVLLSKPLDKTITLTGANQSVVIDYVGSDSWFQTIVIQRTDGGGSEYKWLSSTNLVLGREKTGFPYDDGTADGGYTLQNSYHIFADSVQTSYPFNIKISDAGKPDLFSTIETMPDGTLIPASNEWNVGETITGIHSEDNRIVIFGQNNIYELDTTAQSRQFWRLNKIVSGTGAKDGMQCQTSEGYFFLTEYTDSLGLQILQYNRGQIVDVGAPIRSYCLNNGIITFNEIKYYDTKREVWIIAETASKTYILKYKLDTGQWRVDVNTTTDLNFNVLCPTKNNRMLIGGGDGYVHRQTTTVLQDKIAGNLTSFTTKAKTKHFNEEDADVSPRRFLATLVTSGGSTSTALVRYANADGTEYTSNLANDQAGTTSLPDGVHRLRTASFDSNVVAPKPDIYFQFETTNAKFEVLKNMTVELEVKHGASGGK